jgi:hypothetical protein
MDRLQETVCWLYDISAHGAQGFSVGGISWTASLHVRFLHATQRTRLERRADWERAKYGMPISQVQLMGTLLGSSVLLLQMMEEHVGISASAEDKDAFVHLWVRARAIVC